MNISFAKEGWEDYLHWQTEDKKILKKVNALLKEMIRSPFEGTGNPEALKHNLTGFWSRRITDEHRIVYSVDVDVILVVKCRYHY